MTQSADLCAGSNIEVARERAQRAADALIKWAREAKISVAGQKAQALVLSQWFRDAINSTVNVTGRRSSRETSSSFWESRWTGRYTSAPPPAAAYARKCARELPSCAR